MKRENVSEGFICMPLSTIVEPDNLKKEEEQNSSISRSDRLKHR
jgi:hypothetical protein